MKILLLGKNGQVGWELQRSLAPLGELIALDRHGSHVLCGDLTNLQGIAETIQCIRPDIIVNAGAYTAVDKAESETAFVNLVNAQAPAVLACEAASIGAWLVHYSTDYVFDGSGTKPWLESHFPMPLNHYGASKLEGERAIQNSGCNYLIFRTSWIYGINGNNFIKTIIHLAKTRETLRVITDQVGVPTGADLLADITAHALRMVLQKKEVAGLYHVAPRGETSWYDYANLIITKSKNLGKIFLLHDMIPILSAQYETIAQRPLNSRLSTTKLSETFSLFLPEWQDGVLRMLKQI